MVDQRVRGCLLPSGAILADGEGGRVSVERELVVLVWLLEYGHGAHTATGGGRPELKIL
jgi:hypothetical protein